MVSDLAHAIINIILSILVLILFALGETVLWMCSIGVLYLSLAIQGYFVWQNNKN